MITDGFACVAVLLFMAGVIIAFLVMKRFIGGSAWMGLATLCANIMKLPA